MHNRLFDYVIEDGLSNSRVVEAPTPVFSAGRGDEHDALQFHWQEPAVGDIGIDLAHQLVLGANAEQLAEEHRPYEATSAPGCLSSVQEPSVCSGADLFNITHWIKSLRFATKVSWDSEGSQL